jgi:hypothetical protein
MLSPPSIPARPSEDVFDVGPDELLPWDRGHRLQGERLKNYEARRHTVYVGTYQREAVFAALRSVFPPAPDSFEERPSGSSALLAFVVSEEGVLLEGSVVLSACAWATARTLDPGPGSADWLDGFAALEESFALALEETFIGAQDEREPVVLDWAALAECCEMAIDALGVADVLPVDGIRVRSEKVARRTASVVEHEFLNSFIADDLRRVARAAHQEDVGSALRDYMRLGADGRVDVQDALEEVRRATDPDRVPLGRWPAAPDRALALGQQLAVNEAVAMRRTGAHLFAVNGPPGTGKTTMLRDLIAALVTERAEQLAALPDPSDAFTDDPRRWETSGYRRVVQRLRPELTGFELVVASSNNGAVENVTLEIPSAGAIDDCWREQAEDVDYFPTLAERAMSGGRRASGSAAWALIAARLGNQANRRDFVNAVWWTEKPKSDKDPPPPPGLRDLLSDWEEYSEGESWADAVAAFGRVRDRAVAIRDERRQTREELDRLAELEAKRATAHEAEETARERIAASRPRREELAEASRTHEGERRRLAQALEEESGRRPCVLRFRARAEWRARGEQLATNLTAVELLLREISEELAALAGEEQARAEAAAVITEVEGALEECREILSRYREQPGAQLPNAEWFADRELREMRAPWTDNEWNEARTELFIEALRLHRAFFVHAARRMRASLDGAMEVVSGRAPRDLSEDDVLVAWQVLFLVVPVVSTTFASVPRLFGRLGAEALGWLLVDEAGQATPQNAVGALWRCQRAVVVGDPLQLEPITTIPFEVEQALRAHYDVGEEWLTGRESVQTLADRVNRLGTMLRVDDGRVWVGAPLTVHRRCDQPMFGLSNAIAYNGTMLHATDPALAQAFATDYPTLPESGWIDVPSHASHGHWIPAEGDQLDRLLALLATAGFDFAEVMAITPFRDVAQRLYERRRARQYSRLKAGTIHTAQGKEADVVILVLGSDPTRHRARMWAASTPNLLNVAISRARRRLYVIGDREAWRSQRYFRALAKRLPDA